MLKRSVIEALVRSFRRNENIKHVKWPAIILVSSLHIFQQCNKRNVCKLAFDDDARWKKCIEHQIKVDSHLADLCTGKLI